LRILVRLTSYNQFAKFPKIDILLNSNIGYHVV
jgi:hypothetical protein